MGIRQQVLAASAGRDRVTDFVKSAALLVVVIGHSLAWNIGDDHAISNTLEAAPHLWWLTWVLQILPLFFFIAGTGMVRLAGDASSARYVSRAMNLLQPTVLMFAVALLISVAGKLAGLSHSLQSTLGTLCVQLTWFLGVYLILIALAPLLGRITRPAAAVGCVAVIAGIDTLRVHVAKELGWLNMLVVWGFFAILGMQHQRLRRLSNWSSLLAFAASVAAAILLIHWGPYAKALITVDAATNVFTPAGEAVPMSNLAPPTLVLLCSGVAQIALLMLGWTSLERWLRHERVWVPVAIFGSRAMQVYLFHLLFLFLFVAPLIALSPGLQTLGLLWWLEHLAVFTLTLSAVFLSAPRLRRWSAVICNNLLAKVWRDKVRTRLMHMPRGTARGIIALTGILVLIQSTTGLGDFLHLHTAIALKVYPLGVWVAIMWLVSLLAAASPKEMPR